MLGFRDGVFGCLVFRLFCCCLVVGLVVRWFIGMVLGLFRIIVLRLSSFMWRLIGWMWLSSMVVGMGLVVFDVISMIILFFGVEWISCVLL